MDKAVEEDGVEAEQEHAGGGDGDDDDGGQLPALLQHRLDHRVSRPRWWRACCVPLDLNRISTFAEFVESHHCKCVTSIHLKLAHRELGGIVGEDIYKEVAGCGGPLQANSEILRESAIESRPPFQSDGIVGGRHDLNS